MNATLEKMVADALNLPAPDRAVLAHALIHSLDAEPAEDSAEVRHAWDEEAERRAEEILSGRVQDIPSEDVFARLRSKYG